MAVTQNSYTGNGSATTYSFTFPYLKTADIKASIDATVTTAFTLPTATTLQFNTAPANGAKIKIYRETADDTLTATFYAGSAIKSEDLNDNFTQNLYTTQEVNARFLSNLGGTMVGDLTMDEDADIVFEGATADAHETRLTVADPTADRTVTLPNVTGTVITTGDTGTIATAMLADDAVTTAKLATNSVGTDALANNAVDTGAIAADAVTGAKIADDQINSEHYVDGSIDTAHIADSQITTAKIANDAITQAKIADDAVGADQLAGNSVVSASIVDGTIVAGDIASNAITNAKMADDSVGAAELIDTSVGTAALASNAVTLAKMADSSVGTAELVADAVTGAKIADNAIDSEHYTDGSIDTAHIADDAVTAAKLAVDAVISSNIVNANVTTAKIADDAITTAKIADDAVGTAAIAANAVTTSEIADAELTTLAGMQSGTASILAGSTALTATLAEINTVVDGKGVHTTISDSDAHYPTSGAVVDYVAAQISPIGGLEVIANEDSFPATQPASGVVISIADAAGVVVNGSGVSTSARTSGSGSDNVTINGFPSSLYSETLASGNGLMVTSTGSGHTYNYHKLLASESDVKQLSDDINDFNSRYRINAGEPSSNNDDGDLCWDTNADKMKVYDGTASAWKEVTSSGDFKFLVPVDAGTTTAATWDGSDTSFDLKEGTNSGSAASVTSVYQLMISVNGVVQKPNTGSYSASEEGFYLTDSDTIRFCTAPPTGSVAFILQIGSAVSIPTPGDNTVSTAKIQNLAVTGDKVATNLDLADTKKIRFGTGNDISIYADGSNSYINHNGDGDLWIQAQGADENLWFRAKDDVYIQTNDNENSAKFIKNGAVELYNDNAKKFETTSSGVKTYGELHIIDGSESTNKLTVGDNDDFDIWHETSGTFIRNHEGYLAIQNADDNIDTIFIRGRASEDGIKVIGDGAVELYHDNAKKFETYSGGCTVTGGASSASLKLNTSDGTLRGYIYGDSNNHVYLLDGQGHSHVKGIKDGSVSLYHDNVKKLETQSYGLEVNGGKIELKGAEGGEAQLQLKADEGDDNDDTWRIMAGTTNYLQIGNTAAGGWETNIKTVGNGEVELYYDNSKKFHTSSTGCHTTGVHTFSGNTYPLNDDSTELGLSNRRWQKVWASDEINISDSGKVQLGTSQDLQIYHNGSHSFLENNTGTFYIRAKAGENSVTAFPDGTVKLAYDDSTKFETSADGADFTVGTGEVDIYSTGSGSQYSLRLLNSDATAGNKVGIGLGPANNVIAAVIEGLAESDFTTTANRDGALVFTTRKDGSLDEAMRITSAGDVVIGTTTAARSPLHIHRDNADCYVHITNSTTGTGSGDGFTIHQSGVDTLLNNREEGNMRFYTTGAERMRITPSGGDVLIGSTSNQDQERFLVKSPDSPNCYFFTTTTSDVVNVVMRHERVSSGYTGYQVMFKRQDATNVGSITSTNTATAYNTSSDYRLKENQVVISDGITRLKQLKPYRFNFKDEPGKTVDGFFAHEVTPTVPEAIAGEKDAMAVETRYEDGDTIPSGKQIGDPKTYSSTEIDPQQIDQAKLVPLLTAALQEAITKIETLETKVAALEAK